MHPKFGVPVLVCEEGLPDVVIARLDQVSTIEDSDGIKKLLDWYEGESGYESLHFKPTHYQDLPEAIKEII